MPRFSKRRYKRKPRARKRIDKVQDKRLSRLEESIEKKFKQDKPTQVMVTSQITNTEQIYGIIPNMDNQSQAGSLIGNQISLKNVKVGFQLTNTLVSGADVRVIFFWNVCPRTWATTATTNPPTSSAVSPSWPQLLHGFVGDTVATNSRANMVAGRQLISASNESPIKVLSDRVIHLGGKESSNSSKKLTFSKSYKQMKLTFNNFDGATTQAPVNRQLYMAVLPCHTNEEQGSEEGSVYLSYASQMHYTDA